MKIVCSSSMPFVEEAFGTLGETVVLDGREITAEDVKDADLLVIRSTTTIGPALLDGSRVKFVGTATIGTDHMDLIYLEEKGIRFCSSPGCNATSVSEYVTASLLCLAQRHGFTLEGRTLGVIGVGNVGGRVVMKGLALGMRVLANDPPRQAAEGDRVTVMTDNGRVTTDLTFASLDQVLCDADIITLHVPLTRSGEYATAGMIDSAFVAKIKHGGLFINSARGGIARTDALLDGLSCGRIAHAAIDTWEGEPVYRRDLLAAVDLATPHIAGHSFDGKVKGTVMVYHEACRFLECRPEWHPEALLSVTEAPLVEVDAQASSDEEVLWKLVRQAYDIEADDRRLRETCCEDDSARGEAFDRLRRTYPVRREFPCTRSRISNGSRSLRHKISALRFCI